MSAKKTTRPAKPAGAVDNFETFISWVQRSEAYLKSLRVPKNKALPETDDLIRTARHVAEKLNDEPARVHRVITRNIVQHLAKKASPEADHAHLMRFLEEAFDTVEDLATRSAYIVGVGRGLSLALPGGAMHLPERRVTTTRTKRATRRAGA